MLYLIPLLFFIDEEWLHIEIVTTSFVVATCLQAVWCLICRASYSSMYIFHNSIHSAMNSLPYAHFN